MNASSIPHRGPRTRSVPQAIAICMTLAATCAAAQPATRTPSSFSVVFEDCTEFAGLGPLAATLVQGRVPPGYSVATFGPGTAGVVARAARCERVSVDGAAAERATVSHIGINLVSPDGTGDINNYTLVYVTDSLRLAERLARFGLPVRLDPKLVYEVNPTQTALELFVQVDAIAGASYFLHGSVTDPAPGSEFPFLANWWYSGRAGRIRMSTQIPAFAAGPADVALYGARTSEVGAITGANRTVFPLLSVRGKFSHAVMTVTLAR